MDGMYGLKMCLRNVRHPWRTRRFWYYIRVYGVLFIVLPRVCRCFVMHRHTKIQDGVSRPEIVKPPVRNNIFVKFQWLYLHFRCLPVSPKPYSPNLGKKVHTTCSCSRFVEKNRTPYHYSIRAYICSPKFLLL